MGAFGLEVAKFRGRLVKGEIGISPISLGDSLACVSPGFRSGFNGSRLGYVWVSLDNCSRQVWARRPRSLPM